MKISFISLRVLFYFMTNLHLFLLTAQCENIGKIVQVCCWLIARGVK